MGAKVLNEPPLCLVCSADLYVPHSRPSSRHVKLYIIVLTLSTRFAPGWFV